MVDIIILSFLIAIILKQLRYVRELIIPNKKNVWEIITVVLSIIILIGIMYFYASTLIHYVLGILAICMFLSMWIKVGINAKGFISMYRYKELISWNEIEKVTFISSKNISVVLSGAFMEQTFHFKKSDYEKIFTLLKDNLPKQSKLQVIINT